MKDITDAKRLEGFIRRFQIFLNNKVPLAVMAYAHICFSLEI